MELDVTQVDMERESPMVVISKQDAEELGLNPLDRVELADSDGERVVVADVHEGLVKSGEIGVPQSFDIAKHVEVMPAPKPRSVQYIRRKLDGGELNDEQIRAVIEDINENRLSDVELGAYVSALYSNSLSMDETVHLTEAMVDVGDTVDWDEAVLADKHSIGGVAGNRVTPIIVPIVAAAGIHMPKTSSRAITSPAGTADTVEVLCDVEFSVSEIKEIVKETKACMVWGGAVNLSPVDDKIIRAENPLSLDPHGQVVASVLSKKKSAGSTHVVIDIPYGEGSKVEDMAAAREMAYDFKKVGEHMGMDIACTITRGSEPIGNGIGPVLEAKDILDTLHGDGPLDLELKSIRLADAIFDLCGIDKSARDVLESGAALESFKEIIDAQNGDPDVTADDLEPGAERYEVTADRSGSVIHIDNRAISEIARRAGAPNDQGAGIYLDTKCGDAVDEGDRLFTIYAENTEKLEDAKAANADTEAVRVRREGEPLVEQL